MVWVQGSALCCCRQHHRLLWLLVWSLRKDRPIPQCLFHPHPLLCSANQLHCGILALIPLLHLLLHQLRLHHSWPQGHIADPVASQLMGTVSSQPVTLRRDGGGESQDMGSCHFPPIPSLLPRGMSQAPVLSRSPAISAACSLWCCLLCQLKRAPAKELF